MKTRRAFIQTGAVALCGLAAAPALAKPRKPKDADWTETFDVIVIGSGLAAFVAGLSALESGAKRVALLEKMGMIGGSTAISNGTISVPGSPLQKAQGIEDSPEAMLKDLLKAGKGFCHPELTKTLVGNGVEAFDFIVKHGAKFKDTVMMPGGMTAKRLLSRGACFSPTTTARRVYWLPCAKAISRWAASSSCAARSTGCCSIVTDGSKALRRVRITISIRGSNRTISRTRAGRPCATGRNGA